MRQHCEFILDFEDIREELEAVLGRMFLMRLLGDELLPV